MAHFAEIDANNIVVRVLVVPDVQEHRGQEYLADDLALGGRWIQTSYNNKIRKQFASIGCIYNETSDIFISPQPAWWYVLDGNFDWVCPPNLNPITGQEWTSDDLLLVQLRDRASEGLDLSQILETINV